MGKHVAIAIAFSTLVLGGGACADRGTMESENRDGQATAPVGSAPTAGMAEGGRNQVTVTGCFQDMSGPNNFVLANIGDAPGTPPSDTRSYRIEQSGDYEQYVGKRVNVTGWVEADADQRQGAPAGAAKSGDVDFNDLPQLHVETIEATAETCGAPQSK